MQPVPHVDESPAVKVQAGSAHASVTSATTEQSAPGVKLHTSVETQASATSVTSATGAVYAQPVALDATGAVYVHPPALSHVDESPAVKLQSTEAAHASVTSDTGAV